MFATTLAEALASEHARELQNEAARSRLAHLATCCRPSYLRARFAELRDRLAGRGDSTVCCA